MNSRPDFGQFGIRHLDNEIGGSGNPDYPDWPRFGTLTAYKFFVACLIEMPGPASSDGRALAS